MYLPLWPSVVFALMALGFSLFYGLKATTIFPREDHKGAALWHQRWFNFAGSVTGWLALYVMAAKVHRCFLANCPAEFGLGDAVACFIAFVGITGHLPYTAMGLIEGVRELAKKVTGTSA